MKYRIVDANLSHLAELKRTLREQDQREITCMGIPIKRALLNSYRGSIRRKTAIVDDRVAAMWGVGGVFLSGKGIPWLLTSPAIEKAPIAFVKEAQREVRKMQAVYPSLENHVLASYHQAVGFLALLGFQIEPPEPMGPDGVLYRRFWMEA